MDRTPLPDWHRLLATRIDRRRLLTGAVAAGAWAALPLRLRAALESKATGFPGFAAIEPSTEDRLRLPAGFDHDLIAAWQDVIGEGLQFGFNADWTGFFPLDAREVGVDRHAPQRGFQSRRASSDDGLLVVNHEYPDATFVGNWDRTHPKSAEQLRAEQDCVGLSVLRVHRGKDGRWTRVADERTRRITATTPCLLTGPAARIDDGPVVTGTMGNCSGGLTPWGTALSCEENYHHYPVSPPGHGWQPSIYGRRHHGWVVEIDPFDPADVPRKQTALGRMRHENVAIRVARDGRIVAYMGDDIVGGCLYKFVSASPWSEELPRRDARCLLEEGQLFAADMETGCWLPLPMTPEALAEAHGTALLAGATALDRPEDIEVHPRDGSLFLALTHADPSTELYGSIVRLFEEGDDAAGSSFSWEVFATGSAAAGFAAPDNLVFDEDCNLWACTDGLTWISGDGAYPRKQNDALLVFATEGPQAGLAHRFATAPVAAELTGPSWTPDGSTLFLSVQHPGERSRSRETPISRWPRGGDDLPRPSVVAIRGFGPR